MNNSSSKQLSFGGIFQSDHSANKSVKEAIAVSKEYDQQQDGTSSLFFHKMSRNAELKALESINKKLRNKGSEPLYVTDHRRGALMSNLQFLPSKNFDKEVQRDDAVVGGMPEKSLSLETLAPLDHFRDKETNENIMREVGGNIQMSDLQFSVEETSDKKLQKDDALVGGMLEKNLSLETLAPLDHFRDKKTVENINRKLGSNVQTNEIIKNKLGGNVHASDLKLLVEETSDKKLQKDDAVVGGMPEKNVYLETLDDLDHVEKDTSKEIKNIKQTEKLLQSMGTSSTCNVSSLPVEEAKEAICEDETDQTIAKYVKNKYGSSITVKRTSENTSPDIRTLEDALNHFQLKRSFKNIETSLQEFRKHQRSKVQHEIELKKFDKEIMKLCFKNHPDRVKNRGGSDEEMEMAKNMQSTLNAIRTFLGILNKTFMENIEVDHMYEFYAKIDVASLANEDEVQNHIYEILFKISFISEIKQENIIVEIGKFLTASKDCVQSYKDGKVVDFLKYRDLSLSHLRTCIEGYRRLNEQFKVIEKGSLGNKLSNIYDIIKRMASESEAEMAILRIIKNVAKDSMDGTYKFIPLSDEMDKYFVLPFAYYINVIIMCNVYVHRENLTAVERCRTWLQTKRNNLNNLFGQPDVSGLLHNKYTAVLSYAHYLTLYYTGDKQHEKTVKDTFEGNLPNPEEIKGAFLEQLETITKYLDDTYLVQNYKEGSRRSQLTNYWMECMTKMAEFERKEKILKDGMERLERMNLEIAETYEKCKKVTEEAEREFKKNMEECRKRYDGIPEEMLKAMRRDISSNDLKR